MDVKVFGSGNAGFGGPIAALPAVPADSRAVISDISSSTGLSDSVRTELVQAVAAVDSRISNPTLRSDVLQQVSSLGFYLNNTSDDSMPRWSVLTGLRLYGLNLKPPQASASVAADGGDEWRVAAQVTDRLRALAAGKGVSLEQVRAVAGKGREEASSSAATASAESGSSAEKGRLVEMVA